MKLTFYTNTPDEVDLRPASSKRDWMDDTTQSYAYRCLPLNISNMHGWCFHLLHDFNVEWDGGNSLESIKISSPSKDIGRTCVSVFGYGILTFHTHGVFRTEPDWDIIATGPHNSPKDGISPLTGIIETDWAPYSFTMNWKITRPNTRIRFRKGEPYCMVYPIQHGFLEAIEPEIRPMQENEKLYQDHKQWSDSRHKFIADLKNEDSRAQQEKWQKAYYRGLNPDDTPGCPHHKIKLRLKDFEKKGF